MGGLCRYPGGQYFVWRSPFSQATQARMVSSSNPKGDVTINNLELGALLMQILLFTPRMDPLTHIHTYVDNTTAHGWANRGSVSTTYSVGPILWELALVKRRQHIHVFIGRVPGEDNKMEDAASRLTHLTDRKFISHFRSHFPQSKPCCLLPLPSDYKHQLTKMLFNRQLPRVSQPPYSRKTLPPGANGGASAAGCKYPSDTRY